MAASKRLPRRALLTLAAAALAMVAVWTARSMDDYLAKPLAQPRLSALLLSTLGLVALLVAAIGLYGLMASAVREQRREIGVRMALGASAGDVVREVVGDGLRPVIGGIAVGIAGAAAVSAVLHATLRFPGSMDFLYGVSFYDPLTFGGLSAFMLGVAALASAGPARKAARVDPAVALRWE